VETAKLCRLLSPASRSITCRCGMLIILVPYDLLCLDVTHLVAEPSNTALTLICQIHTIDLREMAPGSYKDWVELRRNQTPYVKLPYVAQRTWEWIELYCGIFGLRL
jgi:hypothetical protein